MYGHPHQNWLSKGVKGAEGIFAPHRVESLFWNVMRNSVKQVSPYET